ncbi:MAG: hypothetical protein ACXWNC_09100 [Anaerolineales bacterium]
MESQPFVSVNQKIKINKFEALAFHDSTGCIRHMHYYIVMEGAEPRPYETIVEEVKDHALKLGNDISKMRVLHITEPFNTAAQYKVDIKKGVLVEIKPSPKKLKTHATPIRKKL